MRIGDFGIRLPGHIAIARFNTDILIAQQPTRHDFEHAVVGELVFAFQIEHGYCLVTFVVKLDGLDAPHHDARALDGCLGLETTDILKHSAYLVALPRRNLQQIARLQRQKKQRHSACQYKQAYPNIYFRTLHMVRSFYPLSNRTLHTMPAHTLNIMAVKRKSSPSTLSEATTTVRVVARDTPSGVGRQA